MTSMNVFNQSGQNAGQVEVSSDIFETAINQGVLHQVVVMQLANKRVGTASTNCRDVVRGSGRKLFRQKGTGMARAGSKRSPLRIGGGSVFGPLPRDFGFTVPKKVKRIAIKSALADKFQNDNVVVVESLNFDRPKTKQILTIIKNLGLIANEKILIVLDESNDNVYYSTRNLHRLNVQVWNTLNTYDILWHDKIVVTQNALKNIESMFWSQTEQ
ncbi:MAG: large subunit ribosomal protein [Candidatus Poribacteria bacterium]|nr:large subunit ribosomal protein [Candidatus Poribacteria bacterium]